MNIISCPTASNPADTNTTCATPFIPSIPYNPAFNIITGSINGSILLQQVKYWYEKKGKQPFYKFKEPCNHYLCRAGDSWCEELGMTRCEFDTALNQIGFKRTHSNKNEVNTDKPVEYWIDYNRITHYVINETISERLELEKGVGKLKQESNFTKSGIPDLQYNQRSHSYNNAKERMAKPMPEMKPEVEKDVRSSVFLNDQSESSSSTGKELRETEQQVRPEKKKESAPEQCVCSSDPMSKIGSPKREALQAGNEDLEGLLSLVPEKHRTKKTRLKIERALKRGDTVEFIKEAILYANLKPRHKYHSYLGLTFDHPEWVEAHQENLKSIKLQERLTAEKVQHLKDLEAAHEVLEPIIDNATRNQINRAKKEQEERNRIAEGNKKNEGILNRIKDLGKLDMFDAFIQSHKSFNFIMKGIFKRNPDFARRSFITDFIESLGTESKLELSLV